MPSGKTHDAITFLLAFPAFAGAYAATKSYGAASVAAAAFVFGGLMFGPDLDTVSRQYSRWMMFRFIWYPYQKFFKHRSRFTHGLIFGALGRVVYFMGALTVGAFFLVCIIAADLGGKLPNFADFTQTWQPVGQFVRSHFGEHFLLVVFAGLWIGAASHTFTDLSGTFIKTGRREKFF